MSGQEPAKELPAICPGTGQHLVHSHITASYRCPVCGKDITSYARVAGSKLTPRHSAEEDES